MMPESTDAMRCHKGQVSGDKKSAQNSPQNCVRTKYQVILLEKNTEYFVAIGP